MSGLSKGFSDPSIASTSQECQAGVENRTLRVTLLSSEWRSSTDGDVSTINRELAIQLAKHNNVQVSVFLPQCSEEDKNSAKNHKVQLIEAEKMTGLDPVYWLINIPENHAMDCIIGHGVHLGRQVQFIKKHHHCKWIQVVHTAPEELGMYKSISEGEKMQQTEIELCEKADQVVAVGPKLADAYKRYLCFAQKQQDVLDLTPSIFTEFLDVKQATEERKAFCVLVIMSGESEDFTLKGYDLAAQAIAELRDKSYQLRFICAPTGKGEEIAEKILQHGISRNQLIVRSFNESREVLARLFCEVDLAIMPSRTEGFGLTALEALSAGLPVLVSGNSGLGEALRKVPTGSICVVDSEDPQDWAKEIKAVRQKDRDVRLAESKLLCEKYLEKYSWQEPCGFLVKKMQDLVFGQGSLGSLPSSAEYSQLPSDMTSQTYQGTYQTQSSSGHGRPPSSVQYNQLPFSTATQTHGEPNFTLSYCPPGTSAFGWPSVEYNQLSFPAATQPYGEASYQGFHSQMEGASGYGFQAPSGSFGSSPLSVRHNQFPMPTHEEPTFQRSHHFQNLYGKRTSSTSTRRHRISTDRDTGLDLSVFHRILKAEYNRRSLLKPLLWENTFKLPLEDVYTRLSIVSRRKTDFCLQNKNVNMYDVFNILNKAEDAMVLVEGSPGIGKTTFCLKIAYDWTNKKIPDESSFPVFELVLLLKCRDIHGDIMEAISEQFLPEDMNEKVKKELMDYIKDLHNQEKVLIILDGLDELPKTAENHVDKLIQRRILPFCYVLATTRQERGIVVRQQVDFGVLLQIEGFTKKDSFDYIRKHFSHFGLVHLSKGERLIKAIQENTFLHELPSNPLNLLLLCVVFEQYEGELPSIRTELYEIIVRCLLRRYCAKHNLEVPIDDKVLEKQFEDSLLALGELAWRCLLEDRHSFREEELARYESNNQNLAVRKLGLVFKEASMKRINPQHEYHFFHKTFQEYLAASYLAHKILKEQLNVFRDFELDFCEHVVEHYRQVFLFVSGILGRDSSVSFGQIGETLKSEGWDWLKCSREVATFFTESFSESRNAEQMVITLCSFIPFPLTVDIDASIQPVNLNILIVGNACANFPQLQHPVHLTVANVFGLDKNEFRKLSSVVADFLACSPKLKTLCLSSFGFISSDAAVHIGDSLAANKTLTTVTFELIDELSEAWASAFKNATSPLPSVVLKIYGSMSDTAVQALKTVLQNRSLISLELIIYGDMTDSQATAVGEGLAKETVLKSLTLIVYGKVSCSAAFFLKAGFLENTSLNFWEVKVFGELPGNWVTVAESVLMAKKSIMSVAVYPYVIGNITDEQVACFCPFFEESSLNVKLQSLTLNLWGKLSCNGAEALSKLLIESSTSRVTLNIHGTVTDAVADRLLRYFKLCKTLAYLCINICGELTRNGNNVLQELSCNGTYSFELNICGVTSGDGICNEPCSTIDVSSSSASVLEKIKDTSKSKLSLTFNRYSDTSREWARGLGNGLAKNTSLTTLSLTFNDYRDTSRDWARGLGNGLAKNTSLTTLNLTLNSYSEMFGVWELSVGDGLAKNTSLTTLSLTFNSCTKISGHWERGLGNGLAKNTSLTTLSLTFNEYSDTSGVWAFGLGDGLAKNTSLTTLSLTFNSCTKMSGDWERGLRDGLATNTSLTTLSLTFNRYGDVSEDWALRLGDGLAKNTSLTTLCLTCNSDMDMSGNWACGLGDGLANNTSLTTLCLTCNSYMDMSGNWARGLRDGLAKNTSLTTLCLTFSSYRDMSGNWARGLGDGLAKNTSLTTLSLTFNSYSDLSGDWARGLGDGLVQNTSLTTLSLTFNSYSEMSGDWGRGLGDGLAKSTSLTTLSLTFNIYSDVSADCLHYLCDSLAKSDSTVNVSFTIDDHSGTSKLLGRDLRKSLSDCKSLTSLNLMVSLYGEATMC